MLEEFDSDMDEVMSQMDDSAMSQTEQDLEDFRLTRAQSKSRFSKPVNQDAIEKLQLQGKAKNTVRATNWAVNVYQEWRRQRNTYSHSSSSRSACGSSASSTPVPELTKNINARNLDFGSVVLLWNADEKMAQSTLH